MRVLFETRKTTIRIATLTTRELPTKTTKSKVSNPRPTQTCYPTTGGAVCLCVDLP